MTNEEQRPLKWPEGWSRTRLEDRKPQSAWKRTFQQSVDSLSKELKRLGATAWLLTRNDVGSGDQGVAVYISMKPVDNYGWQEALGFIGEVPTQQQIDRAYMDKARTLPRVGGDPDPELLMKLTKHRDRARAWARGEQTIEHERVIACDVFKEQRWNVIAIRGTIYCMRMMKRYGATDMTERAWRGFSKQITAGVGDVVSTVA
jgi:hypothetical protein